MTDNQQLRAAAERVRKIKAGASLWDVYPCIAGGPDYEDDRTAIEEAYLAEHRDDEDSSPPQNIADLVAEYSQVRYGVAQRTDAERAAFTLSRYLLNNPRGMVEAQNEIIADLKQQIEALASEHRDDDWEAVTDEWFESVGATWMDSDVQKNALMLRLGPLEMYHFTPYQAVCLYECDRYEMKTRGEVRRLCAALAIPLIEPKGTAP